MNRRDTLLYGATGLAAAAAGAGYAWWRSKGAAPPVAQATNEALWQMRFAGVGGAAEVRFQALRERPLLLNFWATWCPPCVRELPLLSAFAQAQPRWQVVGLAADNEAAVARFLEAMPLKFAVAVAGFDGIELSRTLGNTAGGLPFTVVFRPGGAVHARHLGETTREQLDAWVKAVA